MYNHERARLYIGLQQACADLAKAGCQTIYIDGSFVTKKPVPSDFDGCWLPDCVDPALVPPVLLDFSNGRAKQKEVYGGELFVETGGDDGLLAFFQVDKFTEQPKGILMVDLTCEVF